MTSTPKDGGPAFGHGDPTNGGDPGMSKREVYALGALVGLLTRPVDLHDPEALANCCFDLADAMLKAREQSNNG